MEHTPTTPESDQARPVMRAPRTRADFAVLGALGLVLAATVWWARDALHAVFAHWQVALPVAGLLGLKVAHLMRQAAGDEPAERAP
jgi:hypothetical protein